MIENLEACVEGKPIRLIKLMELPIVNHPDYVAKINDNNKFKKKFGELANHLKEKKL